MLRDLTGCVVDRVTAFRRSAPALDAWTLVNPRLRRRSEVGSTAEALLRSRLAVSR